MCSAAGKGSECSVCSAVQEESSRQVVVAGVAGMCLAQVQRCLTEMDEIFSFSFRFSKEGHCFAAAAAVTSPSTVK